MVKNSNEIITTDIVWKDKNLNENHVGLRQTDVSTLNKIIIDYINKVYSKFEFRYGGNNKIININENYYNTEYISKFANNKITYGNTMKRNNIKDIDTFVNHIKNNLFDLYHYDGIYFKQNYYTVTCTATKGHRGEKISLVYFSQKLKEKTGENITIELPRNIKEDIDGIDGTFMWKNSKISIQVKPFTEYKEDSEKIYIKSNGSMKFDTTYLILYKEHANFKEHSYDIIILSNGENKNQIETINSTYITKNINIKSIDKNISLSL